MKDAPVEEYPHDTSRDHAHRQQQPLFQGNGDKPTAYFQKMTARKEHAASPNRKEELLHVRFFL